MPAIYHLTLVADWETAKQSGFYEAESLKTEGFIHCCEEQQVAGVLSRYFSGKKELLKLVIETGKLQSRIVHEWSDSTRDTFPHIYGPINLDAVVEVIAL